MTSTLHKRDLRPCYAEEAFLRFGRRPRRKNDAWGTRRVIPVLALIGSTKSLFRLSPPGCGIRPQIPRGIDPWWPEAVRASPPAPCPPLRLCHWCNTPAGRAEPSLATPAFPDRASPCVALPRGYPRSARQFPARCDIFSATCG